MANGQLVSGSQNSAGNFIISYTSAGLHMDGIEASLSSTSNAIARNVILDILDKKAVQSIDDMIGMILPLLL